MIPEEDIEIFQTAIDDLRATGASDEEIADRVADMIRTRYGTEDDSEVADDLRSLGFDPSEAGFAVGNDDDDGESVEEITEEEVETDSTDDDESDALLSDFPDNMDMNMDESDEEESDSQFLDRYLGDDSPDQLTNDEYDELLDRDFELLETDAEKAELVRRIVALRDEEPDPDSEFRPYPVGSILHIDGSQVLDQLEGDEMDRLLEEGTFPSGLQQFVRITGQDPVELEVLAQGPDYDDEVVSEDLDALVDTEEGEITESLPMSDEDVILNILGDKGLLELITGGSSPFDIEIIDTIDAPGVTVLYDNQKASRILKILEGVDATTRTPLYGTTLSEEANLLFPVPGSESANIASTLRRQIEPEMKDYLRDERIRDGLDKLSRVQDAITNLSDVFGFDDPAELEAFFAAWLMKNSTCRLSGIPGTGKTTVINSAAVIMGNSYGFSEAPRFYPRSVPGTRAPAMDRARYFFPNGMTYDVSYSARGLTETVAAWDAWRFSSWTAPDYNADGTVRPRFSGSYVYDFAFLRGSSPGMQIMSVDGTSPSQQLDTHTKTVDISSDEFATVLFMHIRPGAAQISEWNQTMSPGDVAEKINRAVRPVQIEVGESGITIVRPPVDGEEYSVSGGEEVLKGILGPITADLRVYQQLHRAAGHKGVVFSTDLGANEGYYLRHAIMHYTQDRRSRRNRVGDYDANSLEALRSEMLREIGIAKIDNDKRADEILYGMEIQQVSETREGKEVNTFVFDPIPRPIVTQPIKFFNEANRSQAGVEDAVLGLIAEKEVEYRGKTFNSPSFVAWMDTNPHQKANDLAFTDRIDTELFFGTISLGQRNAQLQSRYTGASNAKPDIQLVTRIIESEIQRPLRITELGLGPDSIWRFVDAIPFRPPDVTTGYDGLRDIATLSVLFTQRPQLRTGMNGESRISYEVGGETYIASDNTNPHASPLEDISRASVGDIIAGVETDTQIYGEGEGSFQPQTNIKRVLGFRFTDSIVKMSRALAFLRGKEYVGRQEIVDALPYCLGHRLGRARGEAGVDATGIVDSPVPSEQEYVRQTVVHGYLLDRVDANGVVQANTGAFRTWDSFFAYCEQMLASAVNYREFENRILRVLRSSFLQSGENLTTVHWHLATSVVEREKEGITNMHRSHYSTVVTGDPEGDCDYPDVLAHYRKTISRPEKHGASTVVAMAHNFSAADYYKVRGQIASDAYLFSDDKAHLLGLIDSRIEQLCGADSGNGDVSSELAIDSEGEYGANEIVHGNDPRTFAWRTYGDSGGAWGMMIGTNSPGQGLLGGSRDIPYGWATTGASDADLLSAMSDQSHRIMFRCATKVGSESDDDRKKRSEQERRLRDYQLPALKRLLDPLTGTGVLYTIIGGFPMTPGSAQVPTSPDTSLVAQTFPNEIATVVDGITTGSTVRLDSFMTMVDELIRVRMSGAPAERTAAQTLLGAGGIMACFELEHKPGVVSSAANQGISAFLRDLGQGDIASSIGKLRLWLRIHEVEGANGNFVLTLGITSAPAMQGTQTDDEGNEVVITQYASVTDVNSYVPNHYTAATDSESRMFFDSGNLTRDDLVFYDRTLSRAFNSRSASDE